MRNGSSKFLLLFLISGLLAASLLSQEQPPYRNARLPLEQRIADLLSRMTLEEKVAQVSSAMERMAVASDPKSGFVDQKGAFMPDRAAVALKNGIGQISRPSGMRGPRENAEFTNSIQKWVRDSTRLGIPVLFHEECLHGHAASKGTSFPQAIALASTWDPALVEDVFSATASEVRARGSQQCLTPVLDLARDPRWGRTEETYGEDPYLGSRIGVAAVKGFQGTGPLIDKSHVIATAKHFAVHGQPEGGANTAPGNYSERVIREYFLKPFEAAVREGKIQSVMASYNEIDGIPSHSNKFLLDNILRQEWGFDGVVVSDYFGIRQLRSKHHVVATNDEAAKLALESGVDIELPYVEVNNLLVDLVKAMVALHKPIVVFLIHGRPNSINYIAENVPAILEGWYLGQETGTAVAEVLFGDYNPGAKLPISVPRSAGQLPDYYYQKPSARLQYMDSTASPLFPFGWGLSYTAFKYGNLSVSPDSIGPEGKTKVTVDVTNTGAVRGDEVVQLYIRDEVSSVTRPVKELRGFRRITVDPGKTQKVEFTLGPDELSFLNRDMHRVVEPGSFKIMVGSNSVDLIETTLNVKP